MDGQPKIRDIENALIALLNADSAIESYIEEDVAPFNREQNVQTLKDGTEVLIVTRPPGFLVIYEQGDLQAADRITRKTYDYRLRFRVYAFHQNLRGVMATVRGGAAPNEVGLYDMLDDLRRVLGGARLNVPGAVGQPQVILAGPEQIENISREGSAASLPVVVETEYQSG